MSDDGQLVKLELHRCAVPVQLGLEDDLETRECRLPVKATPQLGAVDVLLDCRVHGRVSRDQVTLEEHTGELVPPDLGPVKGAAEAMGRLADQLREPTWRTYR